MNNNIYKQIVQSAIFAYAYHKIILDENGKPVDYQFLDVNDSFEKMTGLKKNKILNKTITDVLPGIKNSSFNWIEYYGNIALNGGENEFEQFSEPLNKWYKVQVYSPEKFFFITVFTDITHQYFISDVSKILNQFNSKDIDYKFIAEKMRILSGANYVALNKFDKCGKRFTTVAIAGIKESIEKAVSFIGFELTGKKWDYDPSREEKIAKNKTTTFNRLSDLTGNVLNNELTVLLEKVFNVGETVIVKTEKNNLVIGDFTLIFEKESKLNNQIQVEAFSDIVGSLFVRIDFENELEEQKAELENFFSVNLDLLCIADIEGNFIKVNKEWEKALGYSSEYLEKKKFLEFVHPDDIESTLDAMSKLGKDEEVLGFVNRYRSKDGSYRFIEWRSHPKGNLIYAAARDVTERKQAEEEMRRQTGLIVSLLNSIPDIIFFKDVNGVYLGCNPIFAELVGKKSTDEVVGQTDYDLFGKEPADFFRHHDNEMLKQLSPRQNEEDVTFPDGRKVLIDTLKTPYRDSNGDVIGILGISRDITKRKQAEKELQHNLAFQYIVSEISSQFVKTTEASFNSDVNKMLETLGKHFTADRSYLFLFSANHKAMTNTHEWCSEGVIAQMEKIQNQPTESLPWFFEQILSCESVHIPDIKDIPAEAAAERKEWGNQNIQSLITVQISSDDKVWGFIGLDSVKKKRTWSAGEINNLKIIANSIGELLLKQQSQKHLETILSNTPAVIYTYTIDKEGMPHLTYINENVKIILGYKPNEFIESMELWASCVHPEDMPKLQEKFSGKSMSNEYRFKDKAGNYHWLQDNQKVLNEKDGETEIIGTWWDITAKKESEEILAKSEDRFNRAISGTGAGLWDWDMVKNTVYFSHQWKKMLGYEEHEIPNDFTGWRKLWHPDEVAKTEKSVNDYLEGKSKVYEVEHRLLCKDGSWHWILTRGDIEKDSTGKPIRWTGTNIDITERKIIEGTLSIERQRLDNIIQGTNVGTWEWNVQTGETIFNERWADIIGYTLKEISPVSIETWMKFAQPDDLKRSGELLEKHFSGELHYYEFESRMKHKDGHWVCVLDRGKVVKWDGNGKPLLMSGTHQDITERKKAEEKLLESDLLLKNLSRQVPGVIYQYQYYPDGKNCFPFASENIWNVYEVTPDEVKDDASKVLSRIHPDDYNDVIDSIVNSYNTLELWNFEYRVILPVRGLRWLSGIAQPEKLADESVLWHGFINDITERKNVENELKKIKEQYHLAIDGSNDGIWDWNVKTNEIFLSAKWKEIIGYKDDELENDFANFENRIHPEDKERVFNEVEKYFSGKTDIYKVEFRFLHKNGIYIWILAKGKVLFDGNGIPYRMAGSHSDITERKKAEEALKQSNDIVENIQLGLYIYHLEDINDDRTLRMLYANPATEYITEVKVNEIIGKTIDENFPYLRVKNLPQRYAEVIRSGKAKIFEDIYYEDNRIMQACFSVKAFPLPSNHVGIAFENITEKIKTQNAVELSNERLKEAQKVGNVGSWEYDITNNKLLWSEQTYHIYEECPENFDVTFENVVGHYPDGDRETVVELFNKSVSELSEFRIEHRIITGNGKTRYVQQVGKLVLSDDKKPLRLIGSVSDITDRKKAEENINYQNQLLQLLISMATGFINISYKEFPEKVQEGLAKLGTFANVDRAYIFEIDYESNTTSNIYEWCAEEIKPEIDNLQNISLDLMKEWFELHKQGKHYILSDIQTLPSDSKIKKLLELQGIKTVISIPMMLENICIGFVGFDAVKEKKVWTDNQIVILKVFAELIANAEGKRINEIYKEETDAHMHNTLEELSITKADLEERAGELIQLNVELEDARIKAELANRVKSEFIANVSHEIRTPMNAILGFSEILLNRISEPTAKEYLKTILSSGRSLLHLINDILDLSKIEAGKMDIRPVPVNLKRLINDIISLFKHRAEEKELDLLLDYPSGFPESVVIDDVRVRQILVNIVGNAIKFTDSGYIKFSVNAGNYRANDNTFDFSIYIEDTGIGIAEEDQKNIFEAFSQAKHNSKINVSGTGLGLAISNRLIQLMGGEIKLQSKLNKGSTFSLVLKNIVFDEYNVSKEEEEFYNEFDGLMFENKKILVVDDIQQNINVLKGFLAEQPFTFIEGKNGIEAISLAKEFLPDIIFMDIRMPEMDGFTATKLVKKDKLTASIPVVAFTASIFKDKNDNELDIFDDNLIKPISRKELFTILMKYFNYRIKIIKEKTENQQEMITKLNFENSDVTEIKKIVNELENNFIQKAEKLLEIFDLNEIILLISELDKFLQKNKFTYLTDITDKLKTASQSFDIDSLQKHLKNLIKTVRQIEIKLK